MNFTEENTHKVLMLQVSTYPFYCAIAFQSVNRGCEDGSEI